jgi:ABC-type Zn uptake system ZnuABC Zn-binding protein ZnuA
MKVQQLKKKLTSLVKKLKPEQKAKIKENMTKINAKLQQIAKALKIDV